MPRHGDAFLEARRPRVILVQPEPEWVLDSYRTRTWYYRDAPHIGDKVTYLRDGFSTRITRVNFSRVYFADSSSMRRPFVGRRIGAWVLPRLQTMIARRPETKQTTSGFSADVTRTHVRNRLRPDAATLYI